MIILTDKMLVIPVGISPNYSSENKPSLEDKSVEITQNGDYSYTAGEAYYGIGNFNVKVNVEIPIESSKTVNPSFDEDITVLPSEGFDAMSSVIVKKAVANLEDKSVQITENGDYIYTTSAPYNGIGNLNVNVNVQEKKIRYAIRPTSGSPICPFTNVLLNETSWVSLDFSMDTSSLNKEKACLFGISASSLHCYLNNGVLHMYTGEEVPMNKQITLDTNKHTLEFGFVSKADESGHAEFEVVFDGEVVADVMVLVPTYNAPLSLFDIAGSYYESYDTYLEEGGITHLVNWIGYGVGDSVFDLFSLTVYDKPAYYRQTLHAYTPSVDAGNKPIFIDNITGEYQYPASGTYSYAKIDGDTRTEIASATYTMPFSNDFQYFRPSESAIVPTDIDLPPLHRITMYVKDIDSFDESDDGVFEHAALDVVKSRAMIGAQPVLVAPFNRLDYDRKLPRLPINESNTAIIGDASVGLFNQGAEVYSTYTYSICTEDGGTQQALDSLNGEHTIKFGQRAADIHYVKTFFMLDDNQDEAHTRRGIIMPDVITRINENEMTPLCIFGTYNFVEGTKPDYVNSLGYQEALNQIGYTTGVRYAVKQIDIEEYPINSDDINTKGTLRHRLVTLTDNSGVNCLFDTITGTPYYPYNGNLDLYTGPVEPEPPVIPDVSILTDTYIKPSAGAIVPTDIKFSAYTLIKMDIKDIDNFDEELDSTVTGDAALNVVKSRVMLGASPNIVISPFNHLDYERSLPGLSINNENTGYLGDSSIGIYFKSAGHNGYSINTEYVGRPTWTNGTPGAALPSLTGEHSIRFGLRLGDSNTLLKPYYIDNQPESHQSWGGLAPDVFEYMNSITKAPICIFGTYNLDESKTPDDVIALGYENALNELGYTTGVRFGVKKIEIKHFNNDRILTEKYSLVPARDKDGVICLYDEVNNKSYYSYNGTLDVYTPPVEPEEPAPTILTDTYIKPSEGAIVPTDIKFKPLTYVKMYVKGFDDFEKITDIDSRAMIGAQPNFIISLIKLPGPKPNIDLYFKGCGNVLRSSEGGFAMSSDSEYIFTVGYRPLDLNNFNIDTDTEMAKMIFIGNKSTNKIVGPTSTPIYKFVDDQMTTPICIFGNYNKPNSMTPDNVIALGYENALSQIGYVTGVRYGVKKIIISLRNADGSETVAHTLVPARDKDGIICLYDTITEKSYYPFHGTLDII